MTMKKLWMLLLCGMMLLLCASASGEEGSPLGEAFTLDETAVMDGMNGRSWAQGYGPVEGDDITEKKGTLTICLPLRSETARGSVTAELLTESLAASPFKVQNMKATCSAVSGVYQVKLKLKLLDNYENGEYPILVRVTGKNAEGAALQTDFPMTLTLRQGRMPAVSPRPVLSDVSGNLNLGENGELRLTLTNPAAHASLTSMMLTVTDATGDVLMTGSDKLPLPDLKAGESTAVTVPVYVRPVASVTLHSLAFTVTYQALGTQGTWTESFTLPMQQEIRLEQGSVQMAQSIIQSEMNTVSWPLMNMGRSTLSNVMVTLELPEVTTRQSVLVGTLDPGETKQAKLTFTTSKEALGDYRGTLTATCEDAYGNTSTLTAPVEVTVEAAIEEKHDAGTAQAKEEKKDELPAWVLYALAGGCGVLLLALILQGVLLRGKIRRLEEDRL